MPSPSGEGILDFVRISTELTFFRNNKIKISNNAFAYFLIYIVMCVFFDQPFSFLY